VTRRLLGGKVGVGRSRSRRRVGAAIVLLAVVAVSVLIATPVVTRLLRHGDVTALAAPPGGSLRPVRAFSHAYVIVLENKAYESIVGSADAPYLNELIARYGLADSYQAVAHPSQPNYLALVSGSTNGITDDKPHDLTAPTLFDQLEQAGKSWRVFAENVPAGCYLGATATDGRDGSGTYARKHDPAISFTAISGAPSRCASIQDLTAFDPGAADLELIIPNQCHDMHDCSTAEGDAWLRRFVPKILDSPSYKTGGALFITFDEGSDADKESNHVATIIASPLVPPGTRSAIAHTHYSLLRTIEEAWHLGCLAESCHANTLGEFFSY
jgi:phosphatidylinositol-3-phosphatase